MATGRISWAEAGAAVTGRIAWSEVSSAAAGPYGRIAWAEVQPEALPAVTGRIAWAEVEEVVAVGVTGRISWSEVSEASTYALYTLTAEAGAYAMTWAGSTGQMVLEAEAGSYLMAEQPATLTAIFDVTSPTINTGDNLRFLKDRNRRPVLFPD